MNIYNVSIEGAIVVAANSNKEAEEKALHLVRSGGLMYEIDIDSCEIICDKYDIPTGWSQDDLPFGVDDNKTITEYLEQWHMQ